MLLYHLICDFLSLCASIIIFQPFWLFLIFKHSRCLYLRILRLLSLCQGYSPQIFVWGLLPVTQILVRISAPLDAFPALPNHCSLTTLLLGSHGSYCCLMLFRIFICLYNY